MSSKAMRIMPTSVMPSKVSELVRNVIDVLGKYQEIQSLTHFQND
jgi:hypothetical protein